MEDFRSVFRRAPFENSWLYSVAKLTRVGCRCVSTRGCPTNTTNIVGTDIIQQPEGCDLVIGQLTLPASRHYESNADWGGPEIIVPQIQTSYSRRRSSRWSSTRRCSRMCETHGKAQVKDPPPPSNFPITMMQLQQQMGAKLLARKWISIGALTGAIAAVAVISMCLWRHWRMVAAFRARCLWGRTLAGATPENHPANQEDEPGKSTDGEMSSVGDRRTREPEIQTAPTMFRWSATACEKVAERTAGKWHRH
jgi:hypothetical protein